MKDYTDTDNKMIWKMCNILKKEKFLVGQHYYRHISLMQEKAEQKILKK